MDINKYKAINKILIEMKEEYKISPSSFLFKKIELAEKKLKEYDKEISRSTKGSGNYEQTFKKQYTN